MDKERKICKADNCEREARIVGFCSAHYERVKKGSGLNPEIPLRKFVSNITDDQLRIAACCTNSWRGLLKNLGFSTMSGGRKNIQDRVRKLGIDVSHFPIQKSRTKCLIDDCDQLSHAKGYCSRHYGFFMRNGDPQKRITLGTKRYESSGYVMLDRKNHPFVSSKAGRIFEHRLIMSEKLGRTLLPSEQVHHKNGQRQDNRIENLERWSTNQPIGGRVADLVVWAKEILNLYGSDEGNW